MAKHNMYDEEPHMERDEHGKMGVKKKEKSHPEGKGKHETKADNLEVHEGHEMHARHSMDRHMMHAKHEHEHMTHKGGGKEEMHTRHEHEHKEMHTRHEKEHGATEGSKDVGEPIAKIEKGAKS